MQENTEEMRENSQELDVVIRKSGNVNEICGFVAHSTMTSCTRSHNVHTNTIPLGGVRAEAKAGDGSALKLRQGAVTERLMRLE